MKRPNLWAVYGLLLGFVLSLAGGAAAGMTDLGDLGSGSSYAMSINNADQIVGYSKLASGYMHAFLYENGVMIDLGSGAANDINDSGQIVGSPGLYDNGAWTSLGSFINGDAIAINNAGQIVVNAYPTISASCSHAYLYDNGQMTDLGTLGGDYSYGYDINNSGQIVGVSSTASGEKHAFLYDNGQMTDLGTLGGNDSGAYGINDIGEIVGYSATASWKCHAFLYTYGGPMMDLGTGDNSCAVKINNSGQIAGYLFDDPFLRHAFIYEANTMTDLGYLKFSDDSTEPTGINDAGLVVGTSGGHAFLYSPNLSSYRRYDFTFYYNNGEGDHYTGSVYAPTNYNGYQVGYTYSVTDENGQAGYYEITAYGDLGTDDSNNGQVFVTSYYDQESGQDYTPVSNGTAVGANYLGSEHDYILQSGVPEFLFGYSDAVFYEADVGSDSRYDFTFYYNNGSGDYYLGYVYAPTSFQSGDLQLTVGQKLYEQPQTFWSKGYQSLNGGYYEITAVTNGFAAAYDKQSYITAYYDADTAKTGLGVNTDGSSTPVNIYVADRTAAWEQGYAVSGSNHAVFNPYTEADVTPAAASPASLSSAPTPTPKSATARAARGQSIGTIYWLRSAGLWEEEK